jgi:hypothetical protein
MNIIGFLCAPLGGSTVQLHESLGSRRACPCSEAGFSSQNGDSDYGVYYRRALFCWQKNSVQSIFIKKCFLFTVGIVCRVKRYIAGRQKFRWWRRRLNGGAEVVETTVKRLPCCGFRRTGKVIGQVYQCWWRICREIRVFSRFEYHIFYFLYPSVTYLLTLPHSILHFTYTREGIIYTRKLDTICRNKNCSPVRDPLYILRSCNLQTVGSSLQ